MSQETAPNNGDGSRRSVKSSVDRVGLPRLTRISEENVKEAISFFDLGSRLMIVLLLREQYSYAEIAEITGRSREVVRLTLSMLHRKLSQCCLDQSVTVTDDVSAVAFDNRDNQGGALIPCRKG